MVHKEVDLRRETSRRLLEKSPLTGIAGQKSRLDRLTGCRREVLQLIAEGQNRKQITAILKVSPKTVEYQRTKSMDCLDAHDIPRRVRFALRVGWIPPES